MIFLLIPLVSWGANLRERLKGKILLKVEDNGKAYYFNPQSEDISFLGSPETAFETMSKNGVGILNKDLSKIPIGFSKTSGGDIDGDELSDLFEEAIGTSKYKNDTDGDGYDDKTELVGGYDPLGKEKLIHDDSFTQKVEGKIFLQVESDGQAWYIFQGKRFFLGRPQDAFEIMRRLSLGISNQDFKLLENQLNVDLRDELPIEKDIQHKKVEYIGNIDYELFLDTADDEFHLRKIVQDILDKEVEKGATFVLENGVGLSGKVIFPSTHLQKAGFQQVTLFDEKEVDYLDILSSEVGKRDLKLLLAIEDLAHIIEGSKETESFIKPGKITPGLVGDFVRELKKYKDKYGIVLGITEELYSDSYIEKINEATQETGLLYLHYFDDFKGRGNIWSTESYYIYPYDAENEIIDKTYLQYINEFSAASAHIGTLDLMFGLSNSFNAYQNKTLETGCTTAGGWGIFEDSKKFNESKFPKTLNHVIPRSCLLYAVRESDMQYISILLGSHIVAEDDLEEINFLKTFNYKDFYQKYFDTFSAREDDIKKPKANVIIHYHDSEVDWSELIDTSLPTLTNALYISGYEVEVTYDNPTPEASLRIILSPSMIYDERIGDFPDSLYQLILNEKTPTLILPLGDMGDTNELPNYTKLLQTIFEYSGEIDILENEKNGIPTSYDYAFDDGIQSIKYRGISFSPHNLKNVGNYFEDQYFPLLDKDKFGENTQIIWKNAEKPIMIKNKEHYLLLGSHIHQETSSSLANFFASMNELGTKMHHKTAAYGVTGLDKNKNARAAFYSIADDYLHVTLPDGREIEGLLPKWSLVLVGNNKIVQFDKDLFPLENSYVRFK